ncbi:Hypothetical protein GLP15_2975 [Giardia lamblia P15]|uniref:Uncharacterized protein n=1 Tax=Giardia intestinalis (strain P15) TaxID=658858 RepID=E1EYW3_GIAIA|nr:Hypothetical protein GLP15_2975 [Giardia lamblia P15]
MEIESLVALAHSCATEALQSYKTMVSSATAGSQNEQQAAAVLKREASLTFSVEGVIKNLKVLQSVHSILRILNAVADQGIDDQDVDIEPELESELEGETRT